MTDLNTNQVETLGIVSEVIADAAFTVLSMLLGREIDLIPLRSAFVGMGEIQDHNWDTIIVAKASFTKGLEGTIYFIVNIEDATRIIDLMLGGEGENAAELDEDSSDALSETINQIMGASCQTLTEKTGDSISIGQVEIVTGSDSGIVSEQVEADEFPGIEFDIELEGLINSKMYVGLNKTLLDSIDAGLHKKPEEPPAPPPPAAAPPPAGAAAPPPGAAAPPPAAAAPPPPGAAPAAAPPPHAAYQYQPPPGPAIPDLGGNIDLLMDIELPVIIRIGRTELLLQDILKLTPGSIIELNKAMDDPIDMLVNNKLVARGEVVVVDGNFAFRITEIVSPQARIRSLG
ncbi:flagellar motor switch protein FliN [Acanthopleuribacter pedis]|uniref:Flagellar motor switch protein FliN n=2 Tax=Acanthopleuribacter pedis TaxID=442870 RepID=A0A8J7U8T7_9BACT|nr:flagellar motor switch protein FliN [Acanthopleuribacter pedis]MBO1322926.1 flagellar motor switch protein FliN [Acanthopleuribacter pedis]